VVKFWQKRACNYANPFMRENTRGYRRKTVNLHVELVSDVDPLTPFCEGWERAIKILGSLTNKSCMHYKPIEKPNMHLLSLEGERMLQG
jgi:hypothetical protein